MNWKIDWDIVTLGRILGLTIIVGGIVVAALDASAGSNSLHEGSHWKLRGFLQEALVLSAYGGIVLAAAQIADSLGLRVSSPARIDWNLPQLIKMFGVIIIVIGTAVTAWDIKAFHDAQRLKVSESYRLFLREEFQYFLWQGGLIIVLAGIAERIGWRSQGEDEEYVAAEAPTLSPPP